MANNKLNSSNDWHRKLTGVKAVAAGTVDESIWDDVHSLGSASENSQVDIYLDATLSMKGFTETESFSFYQQALPLLESSVINTLKGDKVFSKFGNKSEILKV